MINPFFVSIIIASNCCCISPISFITSGYGNSDINFGEQFCDMDSSDFIKQLLYPAIQKTIKQEYGLAERTYFNVEILDICQIPNSMSGCEKFKIKISFETFIGAHNPPYDLNIVTYELEKSENFRFVQREFMHHSIEELSFDK